MRAKRRYITVEVIAPGASFTKGDIEKSVLEEVECIHGVFGRAAVTSFSVKYWNPVTCISLMRVFFGPHKLITTVLPLITRILGQPAQFHTIFIGATLKRCYLNIQKYEVSKLEKLWLNLSTDEERRKFKIHFTKELANVERKSKR
ncbi:unnamed protein product [Bemisia tabaci]|uniref:Ribonuclease P/MRP protein subunit POP5 n=1 Tax=Bemisia tabaci TaxID=7038 RepID=A0A9P0ADT8_BEMTA|nr:PREDICTED: uncharacterized protein LOC109031755 [Bemisia tabaci]CAH0389607.1 unnamed protein product [Bemisia tabaci]